MAQLFSNNADTQLSAPLSDVGTSATLADGSGLNTPTGGDYELLTLIAGTDVEIVRMTARTGNTITITRAQESTVAKAWGTGARIFAGITAGTLETPLRNQSTAAQALALGNLSQAEYRGVALGQQAYANGDESVAVGRRAEAWAIGATALGSGAYVNNQYGIAICDFAGVDGDYGISLGYSASVSATDGMAYGRNAASTAVDATAFGRGARAEASGAVAIGPTAESTAPNCLHMAALGVVPSIAVAEGLCAWKKSASHMMILSSPVSLTALLTHTIPMPTGVTFYPDEVGIIVTAADTVTVQPTVRFGATGAETRYLAATEAAGLTVVRARERFATLASDEGSTTLRAEITIVGAATALTGQFYWRGFAVQQ